MASKIHERDDWPSNLGTLAVIQQPSWGENDTGKRWRHFHVVGSNITETHIPNNTGEGVKKISPAVQISYVSFFGPFNSFDQWTLTDSRQLSMTGNLVLMVPVNQVN